jgi:hypothetical protein
LLRRCNLQCEGEECVANRSAATAGAQQAGPADGESYDLCALRLSHGAAVQALYAGLLMLRVGRCTQCAHSDQATLAGTLCMTVSSTETACFADCLNLVHRCFWQPCEPCGQ